MSWAATIRREVIVLLAYVCLVAVPSVIVLRVLLGDSTAYYGARAVSGGVLGAIYFPRLHRRFSLPDREPEHAR